MGIKQQITTLIHQLQLEYGVECEYQFTIDLFSTYTAFVHGETLITTFNIAAISEEDVRKVVAHEYCHRMQMEEGRLVYNKQEDLLLWNGEYYSLTDRVTTKLDYKLISYWDAPWEHEAIKFAAEYCSRVDGVAVQEEVSNG